MITGGDSGIGRAVALAFAREGADVCSLPAEAEEEDAQRDRAAGARRRAARRSRCPATSREEEQCRTLVERAVDELGGIDILVNNAAYQMAQAGGIDDITTEQFDRVMKTNLYAMFWLCKAAVPHMQPGSLHHQHVVDPGVPAVAPAARLRDDQGGRSSTSPRAGADGGRPGDPGQLRGARARSGRR